MTDWRDLGRFVSPGYYQNHKQGVQVNPIHEVIDRVYKDAADESKPKVVIIPTDPILAWTR